MANDVDVNKLHVTAAYRNSAVADAAIDIVAINKLQASAAYRNSAVADAAIDIVNLNKLHVTVAYRNHPFYIDGDDVRVAQVVGTTSYGAVPVTVRSTDSQGTTKDEDINIYILQTGAPALHSQRADRTSSTAADLIVTTTGSTGTLYWVATESHIQPSAAQIIAGQDHTSAAAVDAGTIAIASNGQKTDSITGLTYEEHWVHCHHVAGDAKASNIVTAEAVEFEVQEYLPQGAALFKRSGDQTTQDYSTGNPVISWNATDLFDEYGVHDGAGANPSKIIIPAALNGCYVVIRGKVVLTATQASAAGYIGILKNGSTAFDGRGGQIRIVDSGAEADSTTVWMQCQTQPILAITGDEFQIHVRQTDASTTFKADKSSMGMLVYSSIQGALVKKSADQTVANFSGAGAAITWNTDIYDADGAHDTGSNTDRITVPAAWNGKYGIVRANVRASLTDADSVASLTIQKAASSSWDGMGGVSLSNGSITEHWQEAESQPVLLTTGDIFTAHLFFVDTSVTVEQESSTFGIQVFDFINGCLAKKTADQTTANYSAATAVAWDGTDIYDTHDLHDPSVSNTKIIVPASLDGRYATLRCQISTTSITANSSVSLKITKNGQSDYDGCGQESHGGGNATTIRIQCATQLIQLATGDEFEAVFWCDDTSITVTAAQSTFGLQIEEVEEAFEAEYPLINGTLVKKYADQTAVNYSTDTIIDWSEISYDSGFFNGSAPSRLTIPAEFNNHYVTVTACVELSSVTGSSNLSLEILKGGSSDYNGRAAKNLSTNGGAYGSTTQFWIQCSTQIIQVSTGEYFEARLHCSDTSVTIEAENSSFGILVHGASVDGSLIKNVADLTTHNFSFENLTWDSEVYDTGTYHDTGSNPARITIPVGANGKYGILKANTTLTQGAGSASDGTVLAISQDGTEAFDGHGIYLTTTGTYTKFWSEVETAAIPLTTAKYYQANLFCSDTTVDLQQENSTFSLRIFDTITGALVKKSADQTTANYSTPTVITWDTDVYDTDTFHDTSVDTSRFTVPVSMNGRYAIIKANVRCSLVATNATGSLCILKNGSSGYDGFAGEVGRNGGLTGMYLNVKTQPILLETGDYYEAQLYLSDTTVTFEQEYSTFSIQVLDAA